MVWEMDPKAEIYTDDHEPRVGVAKRSLRGHNHYVQDVVLSLDSQYCLSGSWDGTLRLWDLKTGTCTRKFCGHTKDVLSVAFSVDNRQVCCSTDAPLDHVNVATAAARRSRTGTRAESRDYADCVRVT